MKLFDIYTHKENNSIIQIKSFATRVNTSKDQIIVFERIVRSEEMGWGSCPSFNGYGTKEEIEQEYKLLVPQEQLDKYEDWDDIFKLIDAKESIDDIVHEKTSGIYVKGDE